MGFKHKHMGIIDKAAQAQSNARQGPATAVLWAPVVYLGLGHVSGFHLLCLLSNIPTLKSERWHSVPGHSKTHLDRLVSQCFDKSFLLYANVWRATCHGALQRLLPETRSPLARSIPILWLEGNTYHAALLT